MRIPHPKKNMTKGSGNWQEALRNRNIRIAHHEKVVVEQKGNENHKSKSEDAIAVNNSNKSESNDEGLKE
jgi:hypothetical protein